MLLCILVGPCVIGCWFVSLVSFWFLTAHGEYARLLCIQIFGYFNYSRVCGNTVPAFLALCANVLGVTLHVL